jgi:hypothetical protein
MEFIDDHIYEWEWSDKRNRTITLSNHGDHWCYRQHCIPQLVDWDFFSDKEDFDMFRHYNIG